MSKKNIPEYSAESGNALKHLNNRLVYSLAMEMPYEVFSNGMVFMSDGSVSAGFKLSPLYVDTQSKIKMEQVHNTLSNLVNDMGQSGGFAMQVLWRKIPYLPILEEHKSQSQSADPMLNLLSESRCNRWASFAKQGDAYTIECELWIRKSYMRETSFGRINSLSLTGASEHNYLQKFQEEQDIIIGQFQPIIANVNMKLSSVCKIKKMNGQDILSSIYRHVLGHQTTVPPYTPEIPIKSYFSGVDVVNRWGYMSLGNQHERQIMVYSVKDLPSTSFYGKLNPIMAMPFPVTIVMNLSLIDQAHARNVMLQKHKRLISLFQKKVDTEISIRIEEIENALDEMERESVKMISMEMFFVLAADDLEKLAKYGDILETSANSIDLLLSQEKLSLAPSFQYSLPGSCIPGSFDRDFWIKSNNVADMMPLYGPVNSSIKPLFLFGAPYKTVMGYDVFDSRLPANHALIFGATGAGKSFIMNLVIASHMSQNPLVFIIDQGGSYKKITNILGGSYVDMADDKISFNPLPTQKMFRERKSYAERLILEMVRNKSDNTMVSHAETIVSRALDATYMKVYKEGKGRTPTLSDIYDILASPVFDAKGNEQFLYESQNQIRMNLAMWTRSGSKGTSFACRKLDNDDTNVPIDRDFVTFNLDGLKGDPALLRVLFIVLSSMIEHRCMKARMKRKLVIFDEAWAMMSSKEGATFVEELYRTMRKFGAAVITISQGIEDFNNEHLSNAIMNNTFQKFILKQSENADFTMIKDKLSLNDSEMAVVRSLTQIPGVYSEVFLKITDIGSTKLQVIPTPQEYWLATSNSKDVAFMDDYMRTRNLSAETAIADLAKVYPNGVFGTK